MPLEVFQSIEKEALKPLTASLYENSPSSFVPADINSIPYIQYKSSKYSVGSERCFCRVHYKAVGSKLHIYDADRNYLCTHNTSECRGSINQLEEHRRKPSTDWLSVVENLRHKWNCCSFQAFINGLKKENPRHLCRQLSAIERFLDAQRPERELVSSVMEACCQDHKYHFSQFKVVYELMKARRYTPALVEFHDIQRQDLSVYKQAFLERCDSGRCRA